MLAAFPADHPMVRGRPRKRIALSELAEESFILYRRHNGPGLYDAVISACAPPASARAWRRKRRACCPP